MIGDIKNREEEEKVYPLSEFWACWGYKDKGKEEKVCPLNGFNARWTYIHQNSFSTTPNFEHSKPSVFLIVEQKKSLHVLS